jgi:hypothetical protein
MILHLVHDEKFVDMAFRIFEEVKPGQNECIVLSSSDELIYIKTTPCTIIDPMVMDLKKIVSKIEEYDIIIIHMLDIYKRLILQHISKNSKIVWIGFGVDYYDLIIKKNTDLFDNYTTKLYHQNKLKRSLKVPIYKNNKFLFIRFLKNIRYVLQRRKKIKLVNSIGFFAPVLSSEYDMIKETIYNFKPQFLDWNYGTLEDDLIMGFENIKLSKKSILIGNSATYENNHLDIFKLLDRLNIKEHKIITPLSYGSIEYRDQIKCIGEEIFGDNFLPLIDFVPINEYITIISSCSVVIMNHIRQQALGNIITMMYLGAVIILKKENPIYKFFKKEGAIIFSVEELENNISLLKYHLHQQDIEINRKILRKYWSREVIHLKTKKLIDIVLN